MTQTWAMGDDRKEIGEEGDKLFPFPISLRFRVGRGNEGGGGGGGGMREELENETGS